MDWKSLSEKRSPIHEAQVCIWCGLRGWGQTNDIAGRERCADFSQPSSQWLVSSWHTSTTRHVLLCELWVFRGTKNWHQVGPPEQNTRHRFAHPTLCDWFSVACLTSDEWQRWDELSKQYYTTHDHIPYKEKEEEQIRETESRCLLWILRSLMIPSSSVFSIWE